jgi:hypothetical protein
VSVRCRRVYFVAGSARGAMVITRLTHESGEFRS